MIEQKLRKKTFYTGKHYKIHCILLAFPLNTESKTQIIQTKLKKREFIKENIKNWELLLN